MDRRSSRSKQTEQVPEEPANPLQSSGLSLGMDDLGLYSQDAEMEESPAKKKRGRPRKVKEDVVVVPDEPEAVAAVGEPETVAASGKKRKTAPAPSVCFAGLIGANKEGSVYAPQSTLFCFNKNDKEQREAVEKRLGEAHKEWLDLGLHCNRFMYSFSEWANAWEGLVPTVVGGATRRFVGAGVPTKGLKDPR